MNRQHYDQTYIPYKKIVPQTQIYYHGEDGKITKTRLISTYLKAGSYSGNDKDEGSILLKSALEKCGRPVLLYATSELGSNLEGLKKFYRRFGFIDVKQPKLDTFPYKYNMIKE